MSDVRTTDRLLDLLAAWSDGRDAGAEPTPEALCPEDAALRDRLRAEISQIKKLEPLPEVAAPTLEEAAPDLPGYQLAGEVGRGSFGVVYRGRQLGLNREVAVKVLAAGGRAGAARFLAEAEAVAAAEHPNVVRVYDTGASGGRHFLALELCDGGTLADKLKAGRLPAAAAAAVLEAVAGGVAAAHARQIVHRDLKPGNVLFAGGVPKVADFGLAKSAAGPDLTATHEVMGTPAYMAPEQASGGTKFVGPAADVWALGVMLYECLSGQKPFAAGDTLTLLEKVRTAEPASLRSVERSVPRELELVVNKCLAKEPGERYPTAAELAADLGRWRRGEPVTARPVPTTRRLVKLVRRNPLPVALVAAVVATLALAVVSLAQRNAAEVARADTAEVNRAAEAFRADAAEQAAGQQAARLRDEHLAQARLALQRGMFKDVVARLDAAGALSAEQKLDRLQALLDLAQADRFTAELAALDPAALPPASRARWHLLRGEDLIGRDDDLAAREVNAALDLNVLPPAAVAFARGLTAADAASALKHFRAAYESQPTHLSARRGAMFTLFVLGRCDEVVALGESTRLLYPDDPLTALLMAMSHALVGREAEALALLPAVRAQLPAGSAAAVVDLLGALVRVFGLARFETFYPAERQDFEAGLLKVMLSGAPLRLLTATPDLWSGPAAQLRVPPAVRPSLALLRSFGQMTLNRGGQADLWAFAASLPADQVERLRAAGDGLDGFALFLLAARADNEAPTPSADAPPADWVWYRAAKVRAGEAYQRSYDASGRLFGSRNTAADLALLRYTEAAQPQPHVGLPLDRGPADRAATLMRRRIAATSWQRMPFPMPMVPTRAAIWAKDLGAAEDVMRVWRQQADAEKQSAYWYCRALLDAEHGAWRRALDAADRARRLGAGDPTGELTTAVRRCRAELGLPELAPAPRPVK